MKKNLLGFFSALMLAFSCMAQSDDVYAVGPDNNNDLYGGQYAADHIKVSLREVATFLQTYSLPTGKTRVIFELQLDYFEPAVPIGSITFSSQLNVLIRPVLGNAGIFTNHSAGANTPLIVLDNCKNLTFDGRPGSVGTQRRWTINNQEGADCDATILMKNGSTNNVFTYLDIKSGAANNSIGAVTFGAGAANNTNKVSHCKILPASGEYYNGVYSAAGNASNTIEYNEFVDFSRSGVLLAAGTGNGYIIDHNSFYLTMPSTNQLNVIDVRSGLNHFITYNNIGGSQAGIGGAPMMVSKNGGPALVGIKLAVGPTALNCSVGNNNIGNINATNDNSSDPAFYGIWVTAGSANIYENNIGTNGSISTEGDTYGILVEGNEGSQIYKNTIRQITGQMAGSYKFCAVSITASGNHIVWYNTIDNTNYAQNNTNVDPLNASTAIMFDGSGTAVIKTNTLSFANRSLTDRAPMTIFGVRGGQVEIAGNLVFSNINSGTNNGKTTEDAGYSFGLYQPGGVVNMHNNYIALGHDNVENVRAIELHNPNDNNSYVYNTIYVGGNPIAVNTTTSFAFYRHETIGAGKVSLINNLFYNTRNNGNNYAIGIGDPTGWTLPDLTASHNLYVAPNANALTSLGGSDFNINDWRVITGETYTYGETTAQIPSAHFFENANPLSSGDLRIKKSSPLCWYVNGKGAILPSYGTDFSLGGSSRAVHPSSTPNDIGAFNFAPENAGTTPTDAIIEGSHTVGGTEIISVADLPVASITWASSGAGTVLPTLNYVKYYSGVQPPSPPSGSSPEIMNAYWDINATGGSNYTYTLKLFFDPATAGTLGLDADATVMKNSGTGWVNKPATVRDYTENSFEISGENGFSLFAAYDANTVLPVSLLYFNTEKNINNVVINWKASSEINHSKYEVERSYNGMNFTSIQTILPADNKQYSAEDHDILVKQAGKIYYRLKMISKMGVITYSAISVVDNSNAKVAAVKITSENPFTDHIDIQFNNTKTTDTQIRLYSQEGKLVASRSLKIPQGNSLVRLTDLQKLTPSTYLLKVVSNDETITINMIKR
jgi:hypothetical protein